MGRRCGSRNAEAEPHLHEEGRRCGVGDLMKFRRCGLLAAEAGLQVRLTPRRSGFCWAEKEKIEGLKFITSKIKLELGGRRFCGVFEENISGY